MENETINEYAALFDAILKRTDDYGVAIAILEQLGKDRRMAAMNERERSNGNGGTEVPATGKQLSYLKQLGVETPAGLTKKAASELIDETLQNGA